MRRRSVSLAIMLVVAAAAAHADAGFERSELRLSGRRTSLFLWYPSSATAREYDYGGQRGFVAANGAALPGAHPLLLFSHGYLGAGDQSIFLTEALARAGYVVAALDHADASRAQSRREPPQFADAASWDDEKFRDRASDLRALLDHVLERSRDSRDRLHGRVDAARVGAIGHSLGGYALLGVAGARPAWRDERIRAFALLSPFVAPFAKRTALGVSAPVMLQGGTLDVFITPTLAKTYRQLAAPKYFATLHAENHFGWTNLACLGRTTLACAEAGNPREIVALTTAFFDRHLRGERAPRLNAKGNLARYRAKLR